MVLKKQKFDFDQFINKIRKKSKDRWGNVGYPDIDITLLETCGYQIDEPEYLDDEEIFTERYNAENDFLLLDKSFKYTKIMQILDNEPEGSWYSFLEYGYLSSKKTEYSFLISAGDYNINYSIGPLKVFKKLSVCTRLFSPVFKLKDVNLPLLLPSPLTNKKSSPPILR